MDGLISFTLFCHVLCLSAYSARNIYYIKNEIVQKSAKEGANKAGSFLPKADSLIKISRIWADFFSRKHIESAYLEAIFPPFLALFPVLLDLSHWRIIWSNSKQVGGWITSPVGYRFNIALVSGFPRSRALPLDDAGSGCSTPWHGCWLSCIRCWWPFCSLRGCCFKVFTLPGRSAISQSTSTSASSSRCALPLSSRHRLRQIAPSMKPDYPADWGHARWPQWVTGLWVQATLGIDTNVGPSCQSATDCLSWCSASPDRVAALCSW